MSTKFKIQDGILLEYEGTDHEVTVPEGITVIGSQSFRQSNVTSVKLPSSLEIIVREAFEGCSLLKEIVIPEGVHTIDSYAFSGCVSLKEVKLPKTLKVIGTNAFCSCSSLEEMKLPSSLEIIVRETFEGCSLLKEIVIPEGVHTIDSYAFSGCVSLKEVKLPKTLKVIGFHAFQSCSSLEEMKLPSSLVTIGSEAFGLCENLKTVKCDAVIPDIHKSSFNGCSRLFDSNGLLIIGGVLLDLGYNAADEIVIPDGVEVIGAEAFENIDHRLKKAILPSSVREIREDAFKNCRELKKIRIPKSTEFISNTAFKWCEKLTEITVDEENSHFYSVDGILFSKEKDILIHIPGGKKLTEYTVPESVVTIESYAFQNCYDLRKICIPASVQNIGDEVFPRYWGRKSKLKDIEISPEGGKGNVGKELFWFEGLKSPLVYPKLPIDIIKEHATKVRLALGFCQNPEMYEEEYAQQYRKFAASHRKTLLNAAEKRKITGIKKYFSDQPEKVDKVNTSVTELSERQKVLLLEQTVMTGTLDQLREILNSVGNFEMTARALAIACRYRGLDYVKELISHRATFRYEDSVAIHRNYRTSVSNQYSRKDCEYYLMIIPDKLDVKRERDISYSALFGISFINISESLEKKRLPLSQRIEITRFLASIISTGICLDEMLFWALLWGETEFADALCEMGADLKNKTAGYYNGSAASASYIDNIIGNSRSIYRSAYAYEMENLPPEKVLPVFERLNRIVNDAGEKLIITQTLFERIKWNDAALEYALNNCDLSGIDKRKALKAAVKENQISVLAIMAENGWLNSSDIRENIIEFALNSNYVEPLAWLIDFKRRTVDIAKEEAEAEKRLDRKLSRIDKPGSVAALRKIWSYRKQEDGTLIITRYKGEESRIEIPSVIGKSRVTAIGRDYFAWGTKLADVTVPEGVLSIEDYTFYKCESLVTVNLPKTIEKIGSGAFSLCENLKNISIPENVRYMDQSSFYGCQSLRDENGFAIVDGCLLGYYGNDGLIRVPDNVRRIVSMGLELSSGGIHEVILPEGVQIIGNGAFAGCEWLKSIVIPASVRTIEAEAFMRSRLTGIELKEGLEEIGEDAFSLTSLLKVRIPETVRSIQSEAFAGCENLKEVYISSGVEHFGENIFGRNVWYQKRLYVHTPAGSAVEKYAKDFDFITVVNDYE